MQIRTKEQIETPALVIDMDKLEANIRRMSEYLAGKKAKLRPHFKTHKSPTIAHMQMAAGAKGLTCSKLGEAEVLAAAGIYDILIANEIVDKNKLYRLAGLAKRARIGVCVDNLDNVTELSEAACAFGSTIYVHIEITVGSERCGINTKEEALALAKQISQSKGLVFEGFQAYAGHIQHKPDMDERVKGVQAAIAKVGAIKEHLEKNGIPVKEISGGGTGTYNITGDNTIWTEIQAGSYIFMDTHYNQLGLDFESSLTILTTVMHKRPGTTIADAGQKVCCKTMGAPAIKNYPGLSAILSDEHGRIVDEKDALKYLQRIEYIPSHCCTTVNLHDYYYCVRGNLWETTWPILGRGKSL